jgi:basic amino acid/polyamine antiporter, APA family
MTSSLPPKLQLSDATALVVSNVIGVGIFTTPAIIASMVPDPRLILVLWIFGGLLAFAGAITYAELGKLCPQAGGEYVYLSRAFGPLVGFLSGWTSLIAGFSGALAAGAVALVTYLGPYLPALAANAPIITFATPVASVTIGPRSLASAGILLAFAAVHALGWGTAKLAQKTLALLVLSIITLFVIAGFGFGEGAWENFRGSGASVNARLWLLALIPVMFTYSGWNAAAYVTEEIRNPERNLGRALALGTTITIVAYLALNALFLYAMPPGQMKGGINVGDVAAQRLFSVQGGFVTPLLIVALAGAISAMTAAGPRVYYAMARDGVFAAWVARVHPKLGTPLMSIALQTTWAIILVLFGGFEQILLYTGFAVVLSSGSAAVALFVLQRRMGIRINPLRNIVMPAVFAVSALVMVLAALNQAPKTSLMGLLLIGAGTPVFWLARRKSAASRRQVQLGGSVA